MTHKQLWWVTFWSLKDTMKSGNLSTAVWQLESLLKQAERMVSDDHEKQETRSDGSEA